MTKTMEQYLELHDKLEAVRCLYGDKESDEEDRILEEMDDVWWKLSESDKDRLRNELRKRTERD